MGVIQPVESKDLPKDSNFLQSALWGAFKTRFGWQELAFSVQGEPLLVLVRRLPGGVSLAYVPHPLSALTPERRSLLGELADDLPKYLPAGTLAVRYDLAWELPMQLKEWGIPRARKAAMDIQPPSTVILSLEAEEEQLLQAMKRKTRYNIRLAARKGVETTLEPDSFLQEWYELYRETAERDQIEIHSYDYYRSLLELSRAQGADGPQLHLVSARHEGDLLAGIIVGIYGRRATYMYGASSNRKRNLMASYAVQWEAIRLAKNSGCVEYDLFGIPPADDPEHPMHGLYRFKIGFGGRVVHRPGTYDVPISPIRYALFRQVEKARNFYFKKLKKGRN
ncbi:MAG TPA: peptidoglycan bridge formation glycyltransferase FemA/FemB family protein [Clostridia bacterium]|nr:peptidoglycan bridge formation glycyltransferase FemA/FemB family protein [Clostridia bacterium]